MKRFASQFKLNRDHGQSWVHVWVACLVEIHPAASQSSTDQLRTTQIPCSFNINLFRTGLFVLVGMYLLFTVIKAMISLE